MFGRKKVIEEVDPAVVKYKELWNEMKSKREGIEKAMLTVIAREGILKLYPTGQNAIIANKRLGEARQDFNEAISLYDKALCVLEQHYVVNEFIIEKELASWVPSRWESGIEIAEELYRNKYRLWVYK